MTQLKALIQGNGATQRTSPPMIIPSRLVTLQFVLIGASVFFSFISLIYTRQITQKEFPSLVQTTRGETIEIGFEDPDYRSPETIKRFVNDVLSNLMFMSSHLPGSQPSALNPDRPRAEGVRVKAGNIQGEITQNAWLAAESLEPGLANTFRAQLSQMTSRDVFTGREEVHLWLDYIKEPEKILDSRNRWTQRWTVDVIGSLKVFRKGFGEVEVIPFNKRVTVRPINAPPLSNVEDFGPLAVSINQIRQSQLQITEIADLSVAETF